MSDATLTVGVPNYGSFVGSDWRRLADLARAADDAAVDRIAVVDHVVMGTNTDAYAWGRFPVPPEEPWLEPLTVLAAMAAATTHVRLATGILIAPLRPAALLAKTVATLDVLSNGRVDLGVGVGWQREEFDAVGVDFALRGQVLTDSIGACRALWSQLPASFTSETTSFTDIFCSPQPLQARLPVWFGGTLNERNLRRVVDLGDGWIVIMGATLDDIRAGAERLAAVGAAMDPPRSFGVQAPVPVVRNSAGEADIAETMAGVPTLLDAGVTDVAVNIRAFCRDAPAAPAALAELSRRFRESVG